MIKFRQKTYTIPEGHYTGPKDTTELPGAVELMAKGALGGSAVGGVLGTLTEGSSLLDGLKKGAGLGAVAGLLAKFLINYSQKPMGSLKYQEVDKAIRQKFGVYRVAGVTIGDSIDKRDKIEDKFSFNDRNVASYKINVAICDNKFTMYTFGMSKEELDSTSNILDYYCKKYYGMEYDSKVINPSVNSYSVAIIFTNVQAICEFIMELSDKLKTKINFLDSRAIVLPRLEESADEKTFSVSEFGPFDLMNMIARGSILALARSSSRTIIIDALVSAANKLTANDKSKLGVPQKIGNLDNVYLESLLKSLRYVEKFDYSIGNNESATNVSMASGLLFITSPKDSDETKLLDKEFWGHLKTKVKRVESGKTIIYTYQAKSEKEIKDVVNRLMSSGVKINIYDVGFKSVISKFRRK